LAPEIKVDAATYPSVSEYETVFSALRVDVVCHASRNQIDNVV
jgi:hypothetical protein